jgi:hypothetical protein
MALPAEFALDGGGDFRVGLLERGGEKRIGRRGGFGEGHLANISTAATFWRATGGSGVVIGSGERDLPHRPPPAK